MTIRGMRQVTVVLFGVALLIMLLCAVAAIFVDDQVMGQLLGTGAATLLASTVLYWGLRQFERSAGRWGGLVTIVMATLGLVFVLCAIWASSVLGSNSLSDFLWLSFLATAVCWLPLFAGGSCLQSKHADTSGRVAMVCFGLIYLGWLLAVWAQLDEELAFMVLGPSAIASAIVPTLLLQTALPRWSRVGPLLIVVPGTLYWILLLLGDHRLSLEPWNVLFIDIAMVVPAACAIVNGLTLVHPKRSRWLRPVTGCFAITGLVCFGVAIFDTVCLNPLDLEETAFRLATASGLAALAGGLALTVVTRIDQSFVEIVHDTRFELCCPRCRLMIELGQGDFLCPNCALKFRLHCESPDCRTCGYTLSPTFPDRCPECGTQVLIDEATDPLSV